MNKLRWWMRIVGVFYLLLGVQNSPPAVKARLTSQYPTLDAPLESTAVQAIIDLWFLFGVEILVVGIMLLVASRTPLRHKILVQTILWLELVRGIFMDIYWLTRGLYQNGFYVGFIVLHLIIIVTGYLFLRQAEKETVTTTQLQKT